MSIMRNDEDAPRDFAPWNGVVVGKSPAPRNWDRLTLSFRPEKETAGIETPRYVLWIKEGGGGGHQLYIRNLEVKVLAYRE